MVFIKSPFNYIGGKYKLLPQIVPLFPKDINTFYDVFGGGFNVGINVKADSVYYNDIVNHVGEVLKELYDRDIEEVLFEIKSIINKYELSKTNEEGFKRLREDYNKGYQTWATFYVLTCYSFNYQYRFNNNHEYNSSFGKNRSSFTKRTEDKLTRFIKELNKRNVIFDSRDFRDLDLLDCNEDDFVYLDPPYLISIGNYNDGKRGFNGWSIKDEKDLYKLCDDLNDRNIRFALSNVTHHKGKVNESLVEWSKKYHIHELNMNYTNSSYQKKEDNKTKSREVLIINY